MPGKNSFLQLSRKVHLYVGLFISPALLFFAFTGAYQTLGLHEAASNYTPPRLLVRLAQIHKKQAELLPVRRGPGPEALHSTGDRPRAVMVGNREAGSNPGDDGGGRPAIGNATPTPLAPGASVPIPPGTSPGRQPAQTLRAKQKQHLPLKLFFLVVSLGLLLSTFSGMYMAYKYDRNKLLVTGLLVAGIIVPLFLLRF